MKELSMHILDIAQNSVRAKAKEICIKLNESISTNLFEIYILDDGEGIPENILKNIKDPFTTSRTLRKVGLGIPLLNDTCLLCNGNLEIISKVGKGTEIKAKMEYKHIDRPPLGDIATTISGLICSNDFINIKYIHKYNDKIFEVSTNELKNILGDISLKEIEIMKWLTTYINENLNEIRY